jgi:ABC-2 type transport system permease protein
LRSLSRLEARNLAAARGTWWFLAALGPLTAHAFASAVAVYGEASGQGGGSMALAQGLRPLDGFLAPLFNPWELAANLLLPFLAIRLLSQARQRGEVDLLLQAGLGPGRQLADKALALMALWILAFLPGLLGVGAWTLGGGPLHLPELATLLLGHLLRGFLVVSLSLLAATLASSASGAALTVLGLTIGGWALAILGAAKGGWLREAARFTPDPLFRGFDQGLLELRSLLLIPALALVALGGAALALEPALSRTRRWRAALGLLVLALGAGVLAGRLRGAWDVTEDRRHSLPADLIQALRREATPLEITLHLAPEDPRRSDLDSVLEKVARHRRVRLIEAARSRTGLFEASDPHYGEIRYTLGTRTCTSRAVAEPLVRATLAELLDLPPGPDTPAGAEGHPFILPPGPLPWLLALLWPAALGILALRFRKPR